jgi:Ca2+-binding EF-hand superfamily protein
MKRPGLTPHLVSATLFLISTFAPPLLAQEMMGAPPSKAARRSEELLKRFDQNGDGKLDDDERADAKEMMLREQLDRQRARTAALPGGPEQFRAQALQMFDRNRDGQLDGDERIAAQKFAAARGDGTRNPEELKKRFDQSRDGMLDAGERAKMANSMSPARRLGNVPMRSELLRRFDSNADGIVDEREFVELERFVRPRMESNPDQLRRHDSNRDGTLDDAEWVAARAAISQWLNAPGPAALENESLRPKRPVPPPRKSGKTGKMRDSEIEKARLKAVADEVARRRAERAAAQKSNDSTP